MQGFIDNFEHSLVSGLVAWTSTVIVLTSIFWWGLRRYRKENPDSSVNTVLLAKIVMSLALFSTVIAFFAGEFGLGRILSAIIGTISSIAILVVTIIDTRRRFP